VKRLGGLFFLCLLVAGCATTGLPPVTQGVKFEEDERRLWTRSEEEQQVIEKSGVLYRDEALEDYLNGIAKKLAPEQAVEHIPFRVFVIKNHLLNAFCYPNGQIYVHTGIFARMDNEAQLATLLAHEMTHATHRHLVKQFRDIKNKTAFLATLQVMTAGFGAVGSFAFVLGGIGTIASVAGYSQEHEKEADVEGFNLMTKAGYDPEEAPKLFVHLKKELEEEKRKEPFFFGTHPRVQERIENYQVLLEKRLKTKGGGITNSEVFLNQMREVILENAQLDLKAGRFKTAQIGAEKHLKIKPKDARGYCLLGDICRQRGEKDDIEKAKEYYQKAISTDSSYALSYKGLGLIYYKLGERSSAQKFLESYLSACPEAVDRAYIQGYIERCKQGGKP
jgi:predicted Zn-dependent protease